MPIRLSTEAINHQSDLSLFKGLTRCFQEIRALPENERTVINLRKTGINELVERSIGIGCNINIVDIKDANASVEIPDINRNHPFMKKYQYAATSKDGLKLFKEKDIEFANIDRKNARITGIFASVPMTIHITKGLLNHVHITPAEIAAIILHEIGHIFSFFETMWKTARCNMAVMSTMEDCVGVKDNTVRQAVLKSAKDQGILEKEFDEKKASLLEDKQLAVVVVSSAARRIHEEQSSGIFASGTYVYNQTAWEQSADQFATRMGAGVELATALNKIQPVSEMKRQFFILSILEMTVKRFHHALGIGILLSGSVLGVILGIWTLWHYHSIWSKLSFAEFDRDYDKPKDRLARIRREVVSKLKTMDKKDPLVPATLEQLDRLELEIEKTSNIPISFDGWLNGLILGFIFRSESRKKFEQNIEQLLNNELYTNAYRFQQLENKLRK